MTLNLKQNKGSLTALVAHVRITCNMSVLFRFLFVLVFNPFGPNVHVRFYAFCILVDYVEPMKLPGSQIDRLGSFFGYWSVEGIGIDGNVRAKNVNLFQKHMCV